MRQSLGFGKLSIVVSARLATFGANNGEGQKTPLKGCRVHFPRILGRLAAWCGPVSLSFG